MPGNKEGSKKTMETQLKKFGSAEALSAEMSRRAKMVKNRPGGHFRGSPDNARSAREKRRQNEERVKRPRRKEATQAVNDTQADDYETQEIQD
jgi:hypothetical protein